MKVIFLDVDGVLNSSEHRRRMLRQGDYSILLEPHHLDLLRELVNASGASLVLISSWRKYWTKEGSIDSAGKRLEEALHQVGLSIYDKTPVLRDGTRSQEIEQWMKCHTYIDEYVILDDNDFLWSKKLRPHWICCPSDTGITTDLIKVALDVLSGNHLIPQETRDRTHIVQRLFNYFRTRR